MSSPIKLLQLIAFLDLFAIGLIIPLVPTHVRKMGGTHLQIGLLGSLYAGFQFCSGPLIDLFAIGLIIPLVPTHVRKMGGTHLQIGLLGSLYAGFQFCSGPLIGSLSDVKGIKPILIASLLVCSILYVIIGLTSSITVILLVRAVLGLFKHTQMLIRAIVPDYEPSEQVQSEIYGKMAAISGIGIVFGPVIGGHIAEDVPDYGFQILGCLVGLCFVINAVLISYFLPDGHKKASPRKKKEVVISNNPVTFVVSGLKQSFSELWKVDWPKYWDVFAHKALIGFAMGIYYSNYSLYLQSEFELSQKYVGYVISFQSVIGSIASFFMGHINKLYEFDKDFTLKNQHVFLLLSFSLLGLIISYSVYFYLIWLIPLAVGNAIGRLVTLDMVLQRSHGAHRGTLIGASNSVRSLSGVVAPMVSGYIGHYFGVEYPIYASLFATLVGLWLSYSNVKPKIE